jgi:hypothetical protein
MRIRFVGLNGPAPSRSTPSRPAARGHRAQPPDDQTHRAQPPDAIAPRAASHQSQVRRRPLLPPPSSLLPPPSSLHLQAPTRQSRQSQVRHCSWSRAPGAIARCSRSRFPDPVPVQCSIPSPGAAPYPVLLQRHTQCSSGNTQCSSGQCSAVKQPPAVHSEPMLQLLCDCVLQAKCIIY